MTGKSTSTTSAGRPPSATTVGQLQQQIQQLQQQLQKQQQQLQQQQQAATATTANTTPANQPTFALSPSLISPDDFIDYSTKDGKQLFDSATEELPSKFDCQEPNIYTFLNELQDRIRLAGWNEAAGDIISTPTGQSRALKNLIENYGEVAHEDILNHAQTYYSQNTRKAQNAYNMYLCIKKSLTDEVIAKIAVESEKYVINGIGNGPLLFKVIISLAAIDTRATVTHIRGNLSSLDTYIMSVNSDIERFNLHVKKNQNDLAARGQTTHDLLANLFKAYLNASDQEFTRFILTRQDAYDRGEDITVQSLMCDAENKFKTLKLQGKWNALSKDQEQIVALTAEVTKLKDNKLKVTAGNKKGPKKNKKKCYKDKKSGKVHWKKVPPKEGESHTKVVKGKTYHWCPKHEAWTRHTPEECKGKGYIPNKEEKTNTADEAITTVAFGDQAISKDVYDKIKAILEEE